MLFKYKSKVSDTMNNLYKELKVYFKQNSVMISKINCAQASFNGGFFPYFLIKILINIDSIFISSINIEIL